MKRRNLILLLGGASSGAMSVGTGAFSSMEAERGVEVSVVDDDRALVGYRSSDIVLGSNQHGDIDLVTVTNQFAQKVSITDATIVEGNSGLTDVSFDGDEIESGDKAAVTATPTLSPGENLNAAVTVRVEGTGVTAEIFGDTETRRFNVEREEEAGGPDVAISGVRYNGKGTFRVKTEDEDADESIEVTVYTIPNGNPSCDTTRESLEDPETLGVELNKKRELKQKHIVAVDVGGKIYQHPGWDEDDCDFNSPGSGDGDHVDESPSCTCS